MSLRKSEVVDREDFIKSQIVAVHKALNKNEFPLKQKHARVLIVGTHKEKAANVFWNTVSRIQLEKNPVLTWKFCHLLHKLVRDGHRKVVDDSFRYAPRLGQLANFWQHLSNSGYGSANQCYCKLLSNRLQFHKRYNTIPGSIHLSEAQLNTLMADLNNAFELAIEMLDQMDDLLNLQAIVFEAVECLRLSSLIPQGQCLLSPLILVILDTSKFYDYLVKIIFKLHSVLSPDHLSGHRERFYHIFTKTKRFYETSSNLQYFKYLVSIPSLPSASDLDTYESPHAFLHGDAANSEADTPPDGRSLNGSDALIDISSVVEPEQTMMPVSALQQSNEMIESLRRELEMARLGNEQLRSEARSRLEQYENRLQHAEAERLHLGQELATMRADAQALAERQSPASAIADAERRVAASEEKFTKMKAVYNSLRQEHIDMLTKLALAEKAAENLRNERSMLDEQYRQQQIQMEALNREQALIRQQALGNAQTVTDAKTQLDEARIALERIEKELTATKEKHRYDLTRLNDEHLAILKGNKKKTFGSVCEALKKTVEVTMTEFALLEGSSAHPDLAMSQLKASRASMERLSTGLNANGQEDLVDSNISALFHFVKALPCALAAIQTGAVDRFDGAMEDCKALSRKAIEMLNGEQNDDWSKAMGNNGDIGNGLKALELLISSLPPPASDVNQSELGSLLEEEMKRMDSAIEAAAAMIQEIHRKARETDSGVRLEVNEKILESCSALMAAIRILVARSRVMQNEIVAAGRGSGSPREFYKRNHQWTEGMLSAAKAVGVCALTLVQTADEVITGRGKLEQLIVASQEIAACTAQLFVSSRVKAPTGSQALHQLSDASRSVNASTAAVVASVRSAQDTLDDKQSLDFSHLTLHQAKRLEMDSQVRMLELESSLDKERIRHSLLRKTHYHLASMVAGDAKERSPDQ